MTHFEIAAKAAYEKFNKGLIDYCEPTWEQLPQDFKERMIDSQIAALAAYEKSIIKEMPFIK